MDYFELMKRRTSSRKFTEEQITEEELAKILDAGMRAPVGSNRYKDLHFTVVEDSDVLQKLAEAAVIRRSNTEERQKSSIM